MSRKDKKLLETALNRFNLAYDAERENRAEMIDDLKFSNLDQWPEEVKRERAKKPMLTLDHTGQHVRQVIGDIRQNAPSIKVRPNDDKSDPDTAEIIEGLIRNIEGQSKAQRAYVTAAETAVKAGFGAWRVITQFTDDETFEQEIVIKRIRNPFTVYFDPAAEEITRKDAKWCFITRVIDKDEFKSKYPKAKVSGISDGQIGDKYAKWYLDGRVRIAEYFVKEEVTKELGLLETGATVVLSDLTDEEVANLANAGIGIKRRRMVKTHEVAHYVISSDQILEARKVIPSKYIPVVPVYGEEVDIEGEVEYKGIIRPAKDPQRMYNYWRTTGVELLALQPKQPFIVTPDQIHGHEKYWNVANKADLPYLPVNSTKDGYPQRQAPASPPVAVWQEAANSANDIQSATGIYNSSLGAKSNEDSGVAILARERQSDTSTYLYIDNLSAAVEYTGEILVDMIPNVYDTERTIRILGEDSADKLVKINQLGGTDITTGKYDVTVVTGPSYATRRIEAANSMMQFVQAVPQAGQVAADLIAESMDWPGVDKIAARLKKMIPDNIEDLDPEDPEDAEKIKQAMAQQQAAQQIQQELANIEIATKRQELEKLQAETSKAQADAAESAADAQLKEQEAAANDERLAQLIQLAVASAIQQIQ